MANSLLTDQKITREALVILHEQLNFIGHINRQYDDSFARSGAKIGSQLKIRLPNKYTVRTGRVANPQSTNETSTTLAVATQKGVDVSFTSDELALSMDDFKSRILRPAMSVLASHIENDAMSMVYDVANSVGTPGTQPSTLATPLAVLRRLGESLAPDDGQRYLLVNGACMASMVNGLQSLFHAGQEIAHQYRKGFILENSGLKWFTNNMIPVLTTGTQDETTPVVNGANQEGASINLSGFDALATIKKGQVVTFSSVYAVHDETKASYGYLKQFTITADTTADGAGAITIPISPAIVSSGAYQNVSNAPGNADTVVVLSGGAVSTNYPVNIGFHKDAFAIAFADLELPKGTDMAYRAVMDGISLRFVRDYDAKEDEWISRFDVLYGYKAIRPEIACRMWGKAE